MWALRLGFSSLKLQLFLQTFFFVNFFVFAGTESGQTASNISTVFFLVGVFVSFYGFKKVKDLLVASEGITTKKQPEDSQSVAPRTAKVEVRETEDGAQIVGKQRTWEDVEKFFIHSLSSKRGKRFIFEIESDVYKDIYFQGYSEPDLSRTIEAAADLSVRPKLSDKQKLAMSVIGWDLPSEDLPNFIMFLETNESGDQSLAQVFTRTLREGYALELGTFSVIAPVR
jgi:hypothetical protein